MEESKSEKIYRVIYIIVITVGITFILTTIGLTYLIANGKIVVTDIITNKRVSSNEFEKFNATLDVIKNKYIDKNIDYSKLEEGSIKGLLSELNDPYTRYISKEEYNEMMTEGTGEYFGIGIVVTYNKEMNYAQIINVSPKSPAEKAGIVPGDIIIEIDGIKIDNETYNRAVDSIKSDNNKSVNIKIKRQENILEKTVEKTKVDATSVYYKIIDNNIGYIQITGFNVDSGKKFKAAYDSLIGSNVKGLIIDIRNNPGGLLSETMQIAECLLPKGIVIYTVDRNGNRKDDLTSNDDEIKIPLSVLVNERSASASEVLAGALKDFSKGTIIGEKTFGKGIVQQICEFSDGSALSYTYAEYHTKSGIKIHKSGIEPDIKIGVSEKYINEITIPEKEDAQLQRAIEEIRNKK